ncbi:unnamed protein product [marine sediment metagenome]|uniref:Uncharacterized protein n=1 Tax=marine sediment metagenome TaxID=412755 RepID=X1R2P7_9ZZZZ
MQDRIVVKGKLGAIYSRKHLESLRGRQVFHVPHTSSQNKNMMRLCLVNHLNLWDE